MKTRFRHSNEPIFYGQLYIEKRYAYAYVLRHDYDAISYKRKLEIFKIFRKLENEAAKVS